MCFNALAVDGRDAAGKLTLELHPLCARHILGYDAAHDWGNPNFFGETPSFRHFQKVLLDHLSGADVVGGTTPNHRRRDSSGNSARKRAHNHYQINRRVKTRRDSGLNNDDDDDDEE